MISTLDQTGGSNSTASSETTREKILGLLRVEPLTVDELAVMIRKNEPYIWSQVQELKDSGQIVKTCLMRSNNSGVRVSVWRLV